MTEPVSDGRSPRATMGGASSQRSRVNGITVFDKMVDSVACYERDGTIAYVNAATCELFGQPREALVGQVLWQVFPDSRGNPFHHAFEHVATTGESRHFEHFYTPWGRWYDNHVYLADEQIWVVARDTSEEKRAALRLEVLANASRLFAGAASDVRSGFEAIARHVAELVRDLCSIRLLSSDGQRLDEPLGIWDVDPRQRELAGQKRPVDAGEALGSEIFRTRRPIVMSSIDPAAIAERVAPVFPRELIEELGVHSVMLVPLEAEGQVLGVLSVCRRKSGTLAPYEHEDLRLLEELADRAALVVRQWRTLELVEDAHQRLTTITDALPALVCLVDKNLRYRFVNAMYERWFGRQRADIIGKSLEEVLGASAFAAVEPHVRPALGGEVVTFEASVPYAVVGERHIRSTNTPYIVDGRVEGYIALVQDITLTKAHEAQLQRWEQLFQHAGWGVAMTEPGTHRLLAVNPAFARMHGYSVPELLGRPLSECLAPESSVELGAHAEQTHEQGHHQFEALHLRKDGSRFPCLTEVSAFRDDSGKVLYCAANFQDITERKRYEAELRAAIATRDEFLSIASHELRTPLTALDLQLDGLARAFERGTTHEERDRLARKVTMAVRQAERLGSLIDGLLNVSRIATGRFRLELEAFDLVGLVHEVAQRFDEEAERVGSSISVHVPITTPGRWDRSRLDQAISNLLSNAVKYGAGRPIDVTLVEAAERVTLSVRDQGIGIDATDKGRIFGRFERAVSSSHYGGLGLGLYIVSEIVQAHAGTIEVDSEPGRGATFTLSLPRHTPRKEPTS